MIIEYSYFFDKINEKLKKALSVVLIFVVFYNFYVFSPTYGLADNFADNALLCIKKPALVFVSVDNRINYFTYKKYVEKKVGEDVIFINMLNLKDAYYIEKLKLKLKKFGFPETLGNDVYFNFLELIKFYADNFNIYSDFKVKEIKYYNQGLFYELFKKSFSEKEIVKKMNLKNLPVKFRENDPEFYNLLVDYSNLFDRNSKVLGDFYERWKKYYERSLY
jgi:hypothetical protein